MLLLKSVSDINFHILVNYSKIQKKILNLFKGSFIEMAQGKNSGGIVEKCIEYFDEEEREEVIEELIFGKTGGEGGIGNNNSSNFNYNGNTNIGNGNNSKYPFNYNNIYPFGGPMLNTGPPHPNVSNSSTPFFNLLYCPNSVYVVQKAFDFGSLKIKKKIVEILKPIMYELTRMPGGKHLKGRLRQFHNSK
jgi:hypothetical protein